MYLILIHTIYNLLAIATGLFPPSTIPPITANELWINIPTTHGYVATTGLELVDHFYLSMTERRIYTSRCWSLAEGVLRYPPAGLHRHPRWEPISVCQLIGFKAWLCLYPLSGVMECFVDCAASTYSSLPDASPGNNSPENATENATAAAIDEHIKQTLAALTPEDFQRLRSLVHLSPDFGSTLKYPLPEPLPDFAPARQHFGLGNLPGSFEHERQAAYKVRNDAWVKSLNKRDLATYLELKAAGKRR